MWVLLVIPAKAGIPELMNMKVIRSFMFSPLGWEKAKNKDEKAKSLDSGMRRNDGGGQFLARKDFFNSPLPPRVLSPVSGERPVVSCPWR